MDFDRHEKGKRLADVGASNVGIAEAGPTTRIFPQPTPKRAPFYNAFIGSWRMLGPLIRAKGTARAVPFGYLPVVMVSRLTVVTAGPQATLLETYVRSRRGRGRSCPVSQIVPSRHGQRGDRA